MAPWLRIASALALLALVGCATNPVTGKNELAFIGEERELEIGRQNYAPARQMQGGDLKVDPELGAYVDEVGQRLAAVSDRKLPYEFVVLNNSVPNAWAMPGGKIAINRGLLVELDNEAELAAVLGHEIVHAAARHGAKSIERGVLLQAGVLAVGIASAGEDYGDVAVLGSTVAAGLIGQKYGRNAELESDHFGMEYMARAGYDPRAAITLQEKFVKLSEGGDESWLAGLFASHPPSEIRVERNRELAATFPPGGLLGEQRYRERIAGLLAAREAYEAYDEGRAALAEKDHGKALRLANRAIDSDSREALFFALRADVYYSRGRYDAALPDYDRALARDPDFFYYYVRRGITRKKVGDDSGARADLERSQRLLPTAAASRALGDLAIASGLTDEAIRHYAAAASDDTPEGRAALLSLARLEIASRPGKYLDARIGVDRNAFVVVDVSNMSPVPLRGMELALRYPGRSASPRTKRLRLDRLDGHESARLTTGLGPVSSRAVIDRMRIELVSVEVAE